MVLVVEDDQLIQGLVESALTEGGFESVIATSGEDAVALLEKHHNNYRALITDINLNGDLVGWDVDQACQRIESRLPVIYMTGAAGDEWTSHGVPQSILLTKPFAPAQIVTAVAQLLNSADPPIAPA